MKSYRMFSIIAILAIVLSFVSVPGAAASSIDPANLTGGPALTLTKVPDTPTVRAGDPIGFTMVVKSVGGVTASAVMLHDALATGLSWSVNNTNCTIGIDQKMTCSFGDLPVGQSVSLHVSAVSKSTDCGTTMTNTAGAWANQFLKIVATGTIQFTSCSGGPDVSIVKTAESGTVVMGNPVRFTITVTNTGTTAATSVVASDTLPTNPGLTWKIDSAPADGTCAIAAGVLTCSFSTIPAAGKRDIVISSPTVADICSNKTISNTATVTATGEQQDPDDISTAVVEVTCPGPGPSLTITKSADESTVNVYSAIGFNIVVSNPSTTTAKNVVVKDSLGTTLLWTVDNQNCAIDNAGLLSCSLGDMAAGASVKLHLSSITNQSVCGTISNTASASTDSGTPINSNTAVVTVACPPTPNITVTKVAENSLIQITPDLATTSPAVRFTMTVSNHGNLTADNVTLTDPLPVLPADVLASGVTPFVWVVDNVTGGGNCAISSGTLDCQFGSLAPGAAGNRIVTISAPTDSIYANRANIKQPKRIFVDNTVTVASSNEPSQNQDDNTATARVRIVIAPNICVPSGNFTTNFSDPATSPDGWFNYRPDVTPKDHIPFLGQFSDETAAFSMGCLPDHNFVRVSFDLYIIGSWDGNAVYTDRPNRTGPGPDHWLFSIQEGQNLRDGPTFINTTFTNWAFFNQAYPGSFGAGDFPPMTGSITPHNSLGFTYYGLPMDTIYHIEMTIPTSDPFLTLVFTGSGLQPVIDESWGLNNFHVETLNLALANKVYVPMPSVNNGR